MYKITSGMTLPEKLRAHASNVESAGEHGSDGAAWCMRDAANVIVCLNATINELEEQNERLDYRSQKVGEGR